MPNLGKNQGMIFVTSLVMMSLLLSLGVTYAFMSREALEFSDDMEASLRAFYYAESGVEHLIARMMAKEVIPGGATLEAWGNLDEVTGTDYWATIDWSSGTIISNYMPTPDVSVQRQVKAKIANFTGAIQARGNFAINAPAGGTIAGNVDVSGTIAPDIGLFNTIGYTVTANNTYLASPNPDLTEYANPANFPGMAYYTYSDCSSLGATPPAGIYYITGDCFINRGGGAFTLAGSLIVTGYLTLEQITGLDITAPPHLPALVAGGNLNLTSISSANIYGYIYSAKTITFTTFAFVTSITGAIVAYEGLTFTNVPNAIITFDPARSPKFFYSGGGGGGTPETQLVKVTSWQGHP